MFHRDIMYAITQVAERDFPMALFMVSVLRLGLPDIAPRSGNIWDGEWHGECKEKV
jgi:hypothetical protein